MKNTPEYLKNLEQQLASKLRCYQAEGIQEIDTLIDQGVKSILRQNFTGTGKSVEQNYLAIRHLTQSEDNIVLMLVHREELLDNLADYFHQNKVYISFIKSGLKTLSSRVYIASVDTLKNKLDKLDLKPTMIIADECFPAGTLVDGKPIEQYKVGDYVWSVDENNPFGSRLIKKKVTKIFKSVSNEFSTIRLSNGRMITSTLNHPYYVCGKGWVKSEKLKTGDEVFKLYKGRWEILEVKDTYLHFEDDTIVYNLEVEDYHTYFVDDILVHNCHHSPAKSWKKILDYYPDAVKLGFSATPERLDGKSFTDIYQALVVGKSYQWYIDNNFLAPFRFVNPGHFVSFDFKKTRGEFDLQQQSEILNNDVINADAVETWHKFTPGLKTVVFCSSVEHSKQVVNAYNEFGLQQYGKEIAVHLDGTTDKTYRRESLKRFKLPVEHPDSLLIISNFNILSEGFNCPDASVTQWLRKTASEIVYDQGNGRSNRYQQGKIQHIIDHVGNKLIHGYPNRIRSFDLKGKKQRELEAKYNLICPNCSEILHNDYRILAKAVETIECDNCGVTVLVPQPKIRKPRQEKEIDLNAEMILDTCDDSYSVNMSALFRKYENLNNKKFFDALINKHQHLTLDDFKSACVYRNVHESYAYSAWSRKLQSVLNVK
ncbi:putative helicase [Calothrix sp. NIES-2100]|uniref:DEAD/DEAH box helicase family protein n=1 Tax=Calothrix sp. NIES-2100 TaxID=1954172 RepID=UPI000B5EC01E|nr:putative helicase [Calothrix sp. NIES-2100]